MNIEGYLKVLRSGLPQLNCSLKCHFPFATNDTCKLIIPVSFPLILVCDKLHLQVAYSDLAQLSCNQITVNQEITNKFWHNKFERNCPWHYHNTHKRKNMCFHLFDSLN